MIKKLQQFIAARDMIPSGSWRELRPIRESKKVTLREVSARAGVGVSFLSDVELGRRPLTVRVAEIYIKIAEGL
jgi:transcriptional regulator with XRE-family HTH domain